MLEKPDLQDEKFVSCLQTDYGLQAVQVTFLPLGADVNTAVYQIIADTNALYFLKLRKGNFHEPSVTLPKFLSDQGITQIIPPLTTQTGQLWANLETFTVILYPFVAGHDGYEIDLTDRHWRDFGTALKQVHTAVLPPALIQRIPQESYSPQWRKAVKMFLQRAESDTFVDPVATKVATLLRVKRSEILDLILRTEHLAQMLQVHPLERVVCHSDVHAGNILIDAQGAFYIVDWDEPILAPKERDLMFVGGGQGFNGHTAQEEETLFYQGYGQTQINFAALAYYRYERIIQDIASFCEQLLLTTEGGADREQSWQYLRSNFSPNSVLEIAYQTEDRVLKRKPNKKPNSNDS